MLQQVRNKINSAIIEPEKRRPYMFPYHEWHLDWPWFTKWGETGKLVLDTGFIEHNFLTHRLCRTADTVTGLDLAEWDYRWKSNNFIFIKQDVTNKIPFHYDMIVCPSLLEHLGLGYYGDNKINDAVSGVINEFHRVLMTDGILLAQVPYGKVNRLINANDGKAFYQIFTGKMIEDIIGEKFDIREISYQYKPINSIMGFWEYCKKEIADTVDWDGERTICVARIRATKK